MANVMAIVVAIDIAHDGLHDTPNAFVAGDVVVAICLPCRNFEILRKDAVTYLLVRNCAQVSTPTSLLVEHNSLSISPESISSVIAFGLRPSTWHPVEKAVPKTSFTVPFRSLAMDLKRMVRAMLMISSSGMDLVCLMFFSFLRSRGGSLRALMTREEAEGTTETAA
jgi:hypothetical protein